MTPVPVLSLIVATGPGGGIGRGGDLLAHVGDDMRRFRRLTLGKSVIMGRKTFESLPGGPLPGRRNIVISRNPAYAPEGAETASSLEEAWQMCLGETEAMVIGGAEIYALARPYAVLAYVTELDVDTKGADTFIEPFAGDPSWRLIEKEEAATDPRTGIRYRFLTYRKVRK